VFRNKERFNGAGTFAHEGGKEARAWTVLDVVGFELLLRVDRHT
jgi:hypothetical protein